MKDITLPTYHNIITSVRTPKVAVLVNTADTYWKDTILRIIEWSTQVWGGAYNIIIPTDGKTIDEDFWKILEKYSPDYIFGYHYTIADLEQANPKRYEEILKTEDERLKKQFPTIQQEQVDDFIKREVEMSTRLSSEISSELSQELQQRLSPFYFRDHIVQEKVSAKPHIPFPLTEVIKIINNTDIQRILIPDYSENKETALMLYSVFGKVTKNYEVALSKNKIKVDYASSKISVQDLLEVAVEKKVNPAEYIFREELKKELGTKEAEAEYPQANFLDYTPFATSMLKLGSYTLRDDRSEISEDTAVLVIGDSLSDFCLYYSLSRMNKNISWLPKKFIDEAKLLTDDKEGNQQFASVASTVVRAIYSKINFGTSGEEMHLSSASLDKKILEQLKATIIKLVLDNQNANRAIITCEKGEEHLKGTLHIIEQNNFANQHMETFVEGKSMGFIPTPKPKNFKTVDPSAHRWITEVTVEGYTPPSLHFLGERIILTGISSYMTRISKYGLSYVSPNWAYFGGDIDTNTIRPKLHLVEPLEIFREYFKEAGYEDIRVSPAGGFSSIVVNKFGSLDEIGVFLTQEKNRELFDKFIAPPPKTSENGEIIRLSDRNYIDFASIKNVLGSEQEAIEIIDSFIDKGIFYRGIPLQCSHCRNAEWYDLSEVSIDFRCKRCSNVQLIKHVNLHGAKEPQWFYKLDEVVYQGVSSNMDVPLLTLYSLKKKSKSSFLYIPEIELRKKPDQEKPDMEIDLCCIVDGEIVIGEAKKTSIEPEEVKKYEGLTKVLKKYPDKVIFSSLKEDWGKPVKDSITQKIKNTTFLFKADLLA